jgi:hypothetical protein
LNKKKQFVLLGLLFDKDKKIWVAGSISYFRLETSQKAIAHYARFGGSFIIL